MNRGMRNKILSIIMIVLICASLGGCFNYTEINKITFATSIIFDTDEFGDTVVYLDCVRPYRDANESSDKGRRVMFRGKGTTALEAIRQLDTCSSNNINYSQVRAYIFTEKAARGSVENYLDLINNDVQFSYKPYMFVYYGDVDNLIDISKEQEEYLGLFLDSLIDNNSDNSNIIKSNFNDYITNSIRGDKVAFMSAIRIKDDEIEQKIMLDGAAVMKDNVLVEQLSIDEAVLYNILTRDIKVGTFQVANPEAKDKFITLDILEVSNKTDLLNNNEELTLKKDLNMRTSVGEIQGKFQVSKKNLEIIQYNEEYKIKKDIEKLFEKFKDKNIDIFGVKNIASERYLDLSESDYLKNVNIDINIKVVIDGSGLVKGNL